MTVTEADAADPTAAAQTLLPEGYPRAYDAVLAVDYPETDAVLSSSQRYGRAWWMASLAALLAAAAAFIVAGVHGARVLMAPPPPPVTVTSTVTVPAPDPNALFLADLDHAGVPHANSDVAIGDAYVVCMGIRNGMTADDLAKDFAARMELPRNVVGRFVEAAHTHYCPGVVLK